MQCLALRSGQQELLAKEIISVVPPGEDRQGFYSHYFLVPNKFGGMRPIFDLSLFNKVIMDRPYHMLTIKQVLECVRQDDWFTSIDLKDSYFHVLIIPKHRTFLRFAFQRTPYQYNSPDRLFSGPPHVLQVCGDSFGAAAQGWEKGAVLSGRPAGAGSVQGGS